VAILSKLERQTRILYYDLGNANYSGGITTTGILATSCWLATRVLQHGLTGMSQRVGVNYHFDWASASAIAQDF